MTARYTGGPLVRYGGKVRLAPLIVPRLPRARTTSGDRMGRVEVLWMSYPAECELGAQASLYLEVRP